LIQQCFIEKDFKNFVSTETLSGILKGLKIERQNAHYAYFLTIEEMSNRGLLKKYTDELPFEMVVSSEIAQSIVDYSPS
jgi:hypothetical protein